MRDHDVVTNFCSKCGAWRGELGLEPTFELYIKHLCDIFDEVYRVLKSSGTCWVNMGDTYGGSGDKKDHKDPKNKNGRNGQSISVNRSSPSKCLLQIPSRFSIEMCNKGWILRNEIIWHKPNAMPSSVKDRFTVDYEKLFFFTKNKKYFFDCDSVREPLSETTKKDIKNNPLGRNKRCVWSINTKPFKEAHFAVYPQELIESPIKSGCPENGVVLDIFSGSGTTALVSQKTNRNFIGFELNTEYCKIAEKRLNIVNE